MHVLRNMGDEQVFREDFTSRKTITENGGSPSATGLTLANGEMNFDGASGIITYPPETVPSSLKGTIAATIKFAAQGATHDIFSSSDESGNTKFLAFTVNPSNVLQINQRDGGAQTTITASTELQVDTEYRVVLASDGSVYTMYVDGVAETLSGAGGNGNWLGDTSDRDSIVLGALKRSSTAFSEITNKDLVVMTEGWTAQEALDDFNGMTYSDLDAQKALISLPLRSHFDDGSNEVTKNLGSEANLLLGDGSTTTTFPTQLAPKGMSFDGGDYLETAATVALAATDSFIFHCRFSGTAVSDYILHWGTSALTEGIAIYTGAGGKVTAVTADAGGVNEVESPLAYTDGVERDMTVTWNNTDASNVVVTVFIDGVSVISSTVDVAVAATQKIVIGAKADKTQGWLGELKDVGLWKTTGTPRQARWLHQRSLKELNV